MLTALWGSGGLQEGTARVSPHVLPEPPAPAIGFPVEAKRCHEIAWQPHVHPGGTILSPLCRMTVRCTVHGLLGPVLQNPASCMCSGHLLSYLPSAPRGCAPFMKSRKRNVYLRLCTNTRAASLSSSSLSESWCANCL